jgi:aspartate racemase
MAEQGQVTAFLGVIGGMGPLATADFLKKLAQHTPAGTDQEHIPVLLYGDCTTPDRTRHILGKGPSPLPQLLAAVDFLTRADVAAICIACNSSHSWFGELQAASAVPLLNIIEATAREVRRKNPGATRVGVLSTQGLHRIGLYPRTLESLGFSVLSPTDDEFERFVSPGIAHVKAGRIEEAEIAFRSASTALAARGAEAIILGCTEIPLGMQRQCAETPRLFVDSTEALALAAIDFFHGRAPVRACAAPQTSH